MTERRSQARAWGKVLRAVLMGSSAALSITAIEPAVAAPVITSDCVPTNGDENCTVALVDDATLDLLGGNDTVTSGSAGAIIGDAGAGVLSGGAGDDTISFLPANSGYPYYYSVRSYIGNQAGSTGQVLGDAGSDSIELTDVNVGQRGQGTVNGGADNDTITLNNSVVGQFSGSTGVVQGDLGSDSILLEGSAVGSGGTGTVSGGDGNDTITLNNYSNIGANGSSGMVLGDAGNDLINVTAHSSVGSSGSGTVSGGIGDDTVVLSDSYVGGSSGATGQVLGDAGNDSILLNSSSVGRNGAGTVSGGDGGDTITLNRSYVGRSSGSTGQVLGDAGADSISLTNRSYVGSYGAGTVSGGDGNDTITLDLSFVGDYSSATGVVRGDAGDDLITLATYSSVGQLGAGTVSGGDGADTISLANSYVGTGTGATGQVLGDGGNDSISVTGGSIGHGGAGTVDGGAGDDTFSVSGVNIGRLSGSTGQVLGGLGADSIVLSGSNVGSIGAGTVSGGDDNDTISLSGSSIGRDGGTGQVLGDAGNDSIVVTSTAVGFYSGSSGQVAGGDGADTITLTSSTIAQNAGSTGQVLGDAGADSITLENTQVGSGGAATVDAGADADTIRLVNGSSVNASSAVLGGLGNDTVFIDNTISIASGATVDGGADVDTLDWTANAAQTSILVASNFEALVKRGAGDLTLTAAQTFANETRVVAGTLSLTGAGAVSSAAVNVTGGTLVTDGGALAAGSAVTVASGATFTVGGAEVVGSVANAGTLDVTGGNLTGLSSFANSGGATIAASRTLSSTTASLTGGTLTNAGTLATTGGTTVASAGTLSSTGSVTGGLANNGNTSAAGSVLGAIQNAGTFTVTGALTGDGAVTNSGTFAVTGGNFTGGTSFTNSNALTVGSGRTLSTGAFTMSAGTLVNNGTIIGGFTQTGGAVSGGGAIQGSLTASSGFIRPGNSIGTINVAGNLTLNAGSSLDMEVTDGSADQIIVNGAVAINGATLIVRDLVGGPAPMNANGTYILIANDGADAITGSGFSSVVDQLAFINPVITLTGGTGNDVALSFTSPVIDLQPVAINPLQLQIAKGFNPVVNNGTAAGLAYFNAFTPLSNAAAAAGLRTLSGEAHAVAQDRAGSDALAFAGDAAVSDCPATDEGRWCFSVRYTNLSSDTEGDAFGGSEISGDADAAIASVQTLIMPNLRIGAAFRYADLSTDIGSLADAGGDNIGVALFAEHSAGPFRIGATLGRTMGDVDVKRAIVVGTLSQTARSGYGLDANFARLEASYGLVLGTTEVRPFAAAAIADVKRDSFLETGAGAANLEGAENEETYGVADVGARAVLKTSFGVTPEFSLAYSHLLGEVRPEQTLSFDAGGPAFIAYGASRDRDRLRVGGALNVGFGQSIRGFVRYEGLLSESDTDHQLTAGFKAVF